MDFSITLNIMLLEIDSIAPVLVASEIFVPICCENMIRNS